MDTKILHGYLQPSTGEGVRPSALAILGRNKPSKADNLATAGREGLETGTPSKQCVPCTTSWSTGRPQLPSSAALCTGVTSAEGAPHPLVHIHSWAVWHVPPRREGSFRAHRPVWGTDRKGSIKPRTTPAYHPATSLFSK